MTKGSQKAIEAQETMCSVPGDAAVETTLGVSCDQLAEFERQETQQDAADQARRKSEQNGSNCVGRLISDHFRQ